MDILILQWIQNFDSDVRGGEIAGRGGMTICAAKTGMARMSAIITHRVCEKCIG
jgi:hypothetical protein